MQHNSNQHPDDEEKPVEKKIYTQKDLLEFQPSNMYSSIGRMIVSHMSSAPSHGFGTADRKKAAKVFQSKELSTTQFVGRLVYLPFFFNYSQEKLLLVQIMK